MTKKYAVIDWGKDHNKNSGLLRYSVVIRKTINPDTEIGVYIYDEFDSLTLAQTLADNLNKRG